MRVELHCHTLVSKDSLMSYDAIIRRVQERGLGALAITDHNKIDGAFELARRAPFPVIIGEEIRTREGEIIGYFLSEWIPPGLTPEETIARIRGQGGLVNIPHPFDSLRHSVIKRDALHRIAEQVDMIEVLNARVIMQGENRQAEQFAKQIGKVAVAGSDAHIPFEIGIATIEIEPFTDAASFRENLSRATWHGHIGPVWTHVFSLGATWRKKLAGTPRQI
ncbi:MAG: PHP domain-containing protein [Chloroflexi bacterium]|nr:PHP domain-containing protein [Chloroflexota bacterium]